MYFSGNKYVHQIYYIMNINYFKIFKISRGNKLHLLIVQATTKKCPDKVFLKGKQNTCCRLRTPNHKEPCNLKGVKSKKRCVKMVLSKVVALVILKLWWKVVVSVSFFMFYLQKSVEYIFTLLSYKNVCPNNICLKFKNICFAKFSDSLKIT